LSFVEFFTAHIRNPNTRAAYGVAMRDFFTWLEMRDFAELGNKQLLPLHIDARLSARPVTCLSGIFVSNMSGAPTLCASVTAGNIAIAITRIARTKMWRSALCDIDLRKRRL
jgi:hypothetical protein